MNDTKYVREGPKIHFIKTSNRKPSNIIVNTRIIQPNSSVTGDGPDDRGSTAGEAETVSITATFSPDLDPAQPSVQQVMEVLSRGVKLWEREPNHAPPCSVEVNAHSYLSSLFHKTS